MPFEVSEDTVLRSLVALVLAGIGYLVGAFRSLSRANQTMTADLAAHRVEVAKDYVPRKDMALLEERLERRFDKMEDWMGRRFDMLLNRPGSGGGTP